MEVMTSADVKKRARECGFELAGIAVAEPHADADRYMSWVASGMAGQMTYLTDRRAILRSDPRLLLPSTRSIICVGKLYNTPEAPGGITDGQGRISRYAWGKDYHDVLRRDLR